MKTILDVINYLQSTLPDSHGGCPVLIGDSNVLSSYEYEPLTQLYRDGVIKALKIITVEEDDSDADKFWIQFEIANNKDAPQVVLREQFGKKNFNKTDALNKLIVCLKDCFKLHKK